MNQKLKRPAIIAIILCLSLIVGLGIDLTWDMIDRAVYPQKYSEYVSKYSSFYSIPEEVIYATIKIESGFDPQAVSHAGAMGLMQLMPSTFEWLTGDEHLCEYLPTDALFDPEVNIRYGTYYLKYLYTKFDHNWETTSAAYNGGEGNVAKWLEDSKYSDGEGNLTDYPKDFNETESYVTKVSKAREMYHNLYYSK